MPVFHDGTSCGAGAAQSAFGGTGESSHGLSRVFAVADNDNIRAKNGNGRSVLAAGGVSTGRPSMLHLTGTQRRQTR